MTCVDIDEAKIEQLNQGNIPIYEPGLSELVLRGVSQGRLHFTTELPKSIKQADLVYLAVDTPQSDDGSADLSALESVVDSIGPHLPEHAIVVIKSTVPVGTNEKAYERQK